MVDFLTAGLMAWFDPEAMGADVDMPFHPAALKYFEEMGGGVK